MVWCPMAWADLATWQRSAFWWRNGTLQPGRVGHSSKMREVMGFFHLVVAEVSSKRVALPAGKTDVVSLNLWENADWVVGPPAKFSV